MSGSIRFRERSGCRPCYNFHDSDDDDVKSTENYVSIDGNDGNVGGSSTQQKRKNSDDSVVLPRKRGRPRKNIARSDTTESNVTPFAERLRDRSSIKKPNYNIDESDEDFDTFPSKYGNQEKVLKIESSDTVSPLKDIDKILDCEMRSVVAAESDAQKLESKRILVKQYLVKWKGLSYLHCTWVPEEEFLKAFKTQPGLKIRVNSFHRRMESAKSFDEDFVAIRPEWTMVDRILACRWGNDDKKEYLVKWKELPYDECHWELESNISAFQKEIERFYTFQCRTRTVLSNKKSSIAEASESNNLQREFVQYEASPEFLSGGSLYPYQLEGLNFLRYSWSKQTHVILADEMGLGKTIQSIAFMASLFEDNVCPHLVIAPLSTLRNWEREFATWAPEMNVVMYSGSADARALIREYEFYFPKGLRSKKGKEIVDERKRRRVKFDVLLTSYETIISDSSSLKPIKWECMIVDEGHRLKNKNSKLFSPLTQLSSQHRVLLTGTPLQNNLDELFMLMHFLDAEKFGSLEEFQKEFKDINREEQILRLQKMLAPHLLRRMKKDVMTELPPKKELILRVELCSVQKEFYKAILNRNYPILTRRARPHISLINVVMELRKLCCHPFMLNGLQPDLNDENPYDQLLESSGKLQLLDKMMVKLKEQGHRVLICSQFQKMLDLLEDYCCYKNWHYERIDGKVGGAERQEKIDRFNAEDSSRFCFLLSTRAGGLGINLTAADTVIIYDSDWNPHADLQAMARSHRHGQKKKVMIYRFIARGTIEERMIQLTKKKRVLEHLVVGRLQDENIKQKELDDIVRYGSEELFADENDEASRSRQIHYDDDAIDRLLDRDGVGGEDAALNGEDEDGFLKAFKVANFEYIDGVKPAEEVAQNEAKENQFSGESLRIIIYWEGLLRKAYEQCQVEKLNALGKGKRTRTKWVGEGFSKWVDQRSDGEDENYEGDHSEYDSNETTTPTRRVHGKKSRAESPEPHPLMERRGKSLKVLGFSPNQRAQFLQIMMRFGLRDFDWKKFASRMKHKSYEEIMEYSLLFLSHVIEDITDSPTFIDGVPKEGLQIKTALLRIGVMNLIAKKVKLALENPGTQLFSDDILPRHPRMKGRKIWKEVHDLLLLQAVLKHGYARWRDIVEDKDLKIQKVICEELNIAVADIPVELQCNSRVFNGPNITNVESCSSSNQSKQSEMRSSSNLGKHAKSNMDFFLLDQHRKMQRAQILFIKRRFRLLEEGLLVEFQNRYLRNLPAKVAENNQVKGRPTRVNVNKFIVFETFPRPIVRVISTPDLYYFLFDFDTERINLIALYNEMCQIVAAFAKELAQAATDEEQYDAVARLGQILSICFDINEVLHKKD
ncbi:CHD3-type chromatin-remodeling factor PICKLE isoform X1 [Vigna unguiculata]|uniref:CHD3-type chromatin-remodeling factor PICKLE isoform X1 n=1 Tax=Vigna unguiculata TaxID=3917 RepID=UPI0010165FF9|nr:CHD3-type chromatin-remodeling factor PICKLE isoform X1 [Vigna unguiculata]